MSMASGLRAAALSLGLLAPLPAAAQAAAPPTEEGAQAIAEAMRGWLAQHTAQVLDLSALGLRVMPDGDAYRLELPFGGAYFNDDVVLGEAALAATVRPLEGGRWEIVDAAMPPRIEARARSRKDGSVSTMTLAIESQRHSGTLDPSLEGPTMFTSLIEGYTTEMKAAGMPAQASRVARMTGRTEWTPSGPGRVTLQGETVMEDYTTVAALPGGDLAKVTIGRLGSSMRMANFDMAGFGAVLRAVFELGAGPAARPEPAAVMRLLDQVFGMLDAVDGEYSYDDIRVEGAMFSGRLRHFGMGLAMAAPEGRSEVRLRLTAAGLETPLIPPGPWVEFVPHKVSLSPRVGGVPKEVTMALLRRAVETEGVGMAEEALAALAANPLSVAIDDLLVEMGPMRLVGAGSLEVSGPDAAQGKAELRASGFDALIRRANAVKELKMAAPVLIFLKGIGAQEGADTVWRISYSEGRMMVNDTDLSDLMPSR